MSTLIGFKADDELNNTIKAKAKLENITVTDLLRRAVTEYLYKDINVQNELLGTLEQINKNIKKTNDQYSVFHSLFLHYLKYFFAVNKSEMDKWKSPNNNQQETIQIQTKIMETGGDYRDKFVSSFKKENTHIQNLIEILLADYMTEVVE